MEKDFTKKKFKEIESKANSIDVSKKKQEWDSYDHYVEFFSKKTELNGDTLLLAMAVAYSWMPTMLSIYIDKYESMNQYAVDIKKLLKIKSYNQLAKNKAEVIQTIEKISAIVNNSVVGTSKVLHFFSGGDIPIIDSRVIKSWNDCFKDKSEIRIRNKSTQYVDYWSYVLYWKEVINAPSARSIEKVFFMLGGEKM